MRNDTETSRVLDIVKRFVDLERSRYAVSEAYLFGSWAYGEPGEDSDIDVGIVIEGSVEPDDESRIFSDAQDIHYRLEPHVFSKEAFLSARRAMVYDMVEKGIRIA